MFTILNDACASSLCINCLEEDDLDLCYSETEVGRCDECGTAGSQRITPIVIAATVQQAEDWARYRRLDAPNVTFVGTDVRDDSYLQGRVLNMEQIVLLPTAEQGRDWSFFERLLDKVTARGPQQFGSSALNSFHFNLAAKTNASDLKSYQRMLYGIDPGVKTTGTSVAAITGVAT